MLIFGKTVDLRSALVSLLALGVAGSPVGAVQALAQSQSSGGAFVGGEGTAVGGDAAGGDASLSGGPGISDGGSATGGSATLLDDDSAVGGDATGGSASGD